MLFKELLGVVSKLELGLRLGLVTLGVRGYKVRVRVRVNGRVVLPIIQFICSSLQA